MQSKNKVMIAAAGSGKTTFLVEKAIEHDSQKVLITTFTNKNREEIRKKFIDLLGYVPKNIDIKTWYSFLLSDCVRPYQNAVYYQARIEGVFYRDQPAPRYIKKANIKAYYLNNKNQIDRARLSDFAIQCFENSNGKVLNRLEEVYDYILIDEVQDMSGYDLDLFQIFFESKIKIMMVGDIRQATYFTTDSSRNKKYRGAKILNFFIELEEKAFCTIEYMYHSHRCIQSICDFSDELFPHLPPTKSLNSCKTDHDGIFIVNSADVGSYWDRFKPQVLRYDSRTKIESAINFGESKGLSFDRVLIKPTKKMEHYLKTGELILDDVTLAKFYVAVTRARYSVALISNIDSTVINGIEIFK